MNNSLNNSEIHQTDVEVLLGTRNGEKYLSEFLESLKMQKNVRIHLKVSDDGSTDRTKEILHRYANSFASFDLQDGPQRGPAINYFELIEKSSFDYVALADQDDVWYEFHLKDSLERLKKCEPYPALTYSILEQNVGNKLKVWPKHPYTKLQNFYFENHCRGCTIVFNRIFKEQIYTRNDNAIMHDWWLALMAAEAQVLLCSKIPEIYYRIHNDNAVGLGLKVYERAVKIAKQLSSRNWGLLNQIVTLEQISPNKQQHNLDLNDFVRAMTGQHKTRRLHYILHPSRFRSRLVDEVALRILFIRRWTITNIDLQRRGS